MAQWLIIGALVLIVIAQKGVSVYQYTSQGVSLSLAFQLPDTAQPYLSALMTAEDKYGLPRGLLIRQALKESEFRPEIIDGTVTSPAGAVGILQIIPRWHPDVNPYDPFASIDYAARYDAQLYRQFGAWDLALAAYNWGPGNVAHHSREQWPAETRDYVASITSDVGIA